MFSKRQCCLAWRQPTKQNRARTPNLWRQLCLSPRSVLLGGTRASQKDHVITTDFTSLPERLERLAQPADVRTIDAARMAPGVFDVRDQLVVIG
jgi:hypothetical protein